MSERFIYSTFFLIATFALSGIFRAWRAITSGPLAVFDILLGLLSVVALLGSIFVLGLFVYNDEKRKGNLKREVKIYEKMLNRRRDG